MMLLMAKPLKHLFNSLFLLLTLSVLSACDFTSGLNRDILTAQTYVDNQEFNKAVELYERILVKNPSKIIKTKVSYQLAEIY